MDPGNYYCVEISDTGCGMSVDEIQNILDPFFSTKFTGRGLGLPLVLGTVLAHGGGLNFHSRLGKGTTVAMLLPVLDQYSEEIDSATVISEVSND